MVGKNRKNNSVDKEKVPFTEENDTLCVNNRAMAKAMNIAESFRRGNAHFDPLGSWTGVPKDGNEQPTQDADDL